MKRIGTSLVTTALAGALLIGSAVPGFAAPPAGHCPHPPITAESVWACVCSIVMPNLGDDWRCAGLG